MMYLNEFTTTSISNIQKPLDKDSGLIIDSVVDDNITISKKKKSLSWKQLHKIAKRIRPSKKTIN